MIVDKKSKQVISGNAPSTSAPPEPVGEKKVIYQQMPSVGIIEVFKAVKEILRNTRWEYGNPNSEPIFKTVMLDSGQFERITRNGVNLEDGIAFPAVFIHFINVYWLKPTARVKDGRATLRVRFIMNRLNVHDNDDTESEGFYVAQRIKQEFEEQRYNYDALQDRLSLDYFDQVNSFDNSLQPWWMNWEVWFKETSVWVQRKLTKRFVVFPPFTNHYDQTNPEKQNPDGHGNLDHPITYDEATKFVYGGIPPTNDETEDKTEQ